ncbi:MAG: (2Fe-2S)-binding protein [Gaiellales bacterium]
MDGVRTSDEAGLVPVAAGEIEFVVNGRAWRGTIPLRRLLVDVLRDDVGLTGTHVGCEHGVCGACTVVVDGRAARSCCLLAVQVDGSRLETVEGLAPGRTPMTQLQEAFRAHHALQCGFCTPGILMTLSAADPDEYPDEQAIRELLSGHLCRCTGYQNIVAAVESAWGRPL